MEKYAMVDIPDNIYNWLVAYYSGHSHCTKYRGLMSEQLEISANIVSPTRVSHWTGFI